MTLDEYQQEASKTAVYRKDFGIPYCTLGLVGEAGEVANKVKKLFRDFDEHDSLATMLNGTDVLSEVGDVLWYISQLCKEFGVSLNSVAEDNLTKLKDRQKRGMIKGQGDRR